MDICPFQFSGKSATVDQFTFISELSAKALPAIYSGYEMIKYSIYFRNSSNEFAGLFFGIQQGMSNRQTSKSK